MDALGHIKSQSKLIPREKQVELHKLAMAGDTEARNELVMGFIGLALKLTNKHKPKKVDRDDAIQEAFLSIVEALPYWKPELGEFSTILTMRITQQFVRISNSDRLIRTPNNWTSEQRKPLTPSVVSSWGSSKSDDQFVRNRDSTAQAGWCPDHADPTVPAERKEAINRVREGLRQINPIDASICLRVAGGETFTAIGPSIGMSRERTGERYHRGMAFLKTNGDLMELEAA
jgi:RNA polymerase sigma factor (sigma-70 family)